MPGTTTLRAFVPVDQMQPQYAAYWGLTGLGALPLAGMAELFVEVFPGNEVFRLVDAALKAAGVHSTGQLVERDFGLLELHAFDPEAVAAAGRAVLGALGVRAEDRLAPRVVSSQVLAGVTAYQSQLYNRVRRGTWTLPGDTMFNLEVTPASYAYLVANEVEKAVPVGLVRVAGTGLYGRLLVAGTEAAAREAEVAALAAIERVRATSTGAHLEGA